MAPYEAIRTSRDSQSESGADAQVTSPLLLQLHRDNSGATVDLRSDRDSHLLATDLVPNCYVEEHYGTSTTGSSHRRSGNTASTRHAGETAPTSYPPSSRGEQKKRRVSSSPSSLYVNHDSSDDSGSSGRELQMQTNLSSMGQHMPNRYTPNGRRRVKIHYTADASRIDPSRNNVHVSYGVPPPSDTPGMVDLETASSRSDKAALEEVSWTLKSKMIFALVLALLFVCLALAARSMWVNNHKKDLRALEAILCTVVIVAIPSLTLSAYSGWSLRASLNHCVESCVLTSLLCGCIFVAFRHEN